MIDIRNPFPGGLQGIQALLGSYASPEAAERDIFRSPHGRDYVEDEYRRLTGDEFANPYADASRSRDAEVMNAVAGGASFAFGGSSGPQMLIPPTAIPSQSSPTTSRRRANGLVASNPEVATLQSDPYEEALARPSLQFSAAVGANPFAEGKDMINPDLSPSDRIQRNRANTAGGAAAELWQHYAKNAPELLRPPTTSDQSLEFDDKGKPIAGDVLHRKLFDDPKFQNLLRTNRTQAANFYKAVTDRDLATDIQMQGGRQASMQKAQQSLVDEFNQKNGRFDPYTGEATMTRQVADPLNPGQFKDVEMPVGDAMKAAVSRYYTARTDQPLPQGFDVSGAGSITAEQQMALRQRMKQLKAENPNVPDNAIMMLAQKELFGVGGRPAAPPSKMGAAASAIDTMITGAINKGFVDPMNQSRFVELPRATTFAEKNRTFGDDIGDFFYGAADTYNDFSLRDYMTRGLESRGYKRVKRNER